MGGAMSDIPSPCNRVCTIDRDTGQCIGCARTLDEISRWASMQSAERTRLMAELPQRLGARVSVTCSSCGASFSCGANDREHPCWCVRYPPVVPDCAAKGCLCPACLAASGRTTP